MSLSSLLKAGKGPVWDWFEASFPNTKAVSMEANRRLRGGPSSRPCDIPPAVGSDSSLVGTAVGYLLTAHLRPESLHTKSVAKRGAGLLSQRVPKHIDCVATECAVVQRLAELLAHEAQSDAQNWQEICLLCIVLSRFEQWFRAGEVVAAYTVDPLTAWKDDSLVSLGHSMTRDPTINDLMVLGRAVLEDHGDMALASTLHIGPTFTQSRSLGGADADLICEGLLLDLKSSARAGIVSRHELWQLAGYLLADTADEYDMHSVGFAALRWRRCISWPALDFLKEMGGGERSLGEWRSEFADLLAPLVVEPRLPREERRRGAASTCQIAEVARATDRSCRSALSRTHQAPIGALACS